MLGGVSINENLVEFVRVENGVVIHKQIEKRDGLTFMRIKKRALAL